MTVFATQKAGDLCQNVINEQCQRTSWGYIICLRCAAASYHNCYIMLMRIRKRRLLQQSKQPSHGSRIMHHTRSCSDLDTEPLRADRCMCDLCLLITPVYSGWVLLWGASVDFCWPAATLLVVSGICDHLDFVWPYTQSNHTVLELFPNLLEKSESATHTAHKWRACLYCMCHM